MVPELVYTRTFARQSYPKFLRVSRGLTQKRHPHVARKGLMDDFAKMGRKLQGGLPIIGLVSRLTSTDGEFDEDQSYPAFCRAILDAGHQRLNQGIMDLESRYKKRAGHRTVLLFLWMVKKGCGMLPDKAFILAARRLSASMDIEAEMGRFEIALEAEAKKYTYIDRPIAPADKQAVIATDAIATCCCGLRNQQPLSAEDQSSLVDILSDAFPTVSEEFLFEIVSDRSAAERKYD